MEVLIMSTLGRREKEGSSSKGGSIDPPPRSVTLIHCLEKWISRVDCANVLIVHIIKIIRNRVLHHCHDAFTNDLILASSILYFTKIYR